MKNSFIIYNDQEEVINQLSDEDAGKLFKAIFDYNLKKEVKLDGYLKIIFTQIKIFLDKDQKKYEKTCEKNKQNVLTRWGKNDIEEKQKKYGGKNGILKNTKNTDNDNDNDNDNDIKKNNKKKYGEFKNVLLTKNEYKKLEEKNLLRYIEILSCYISSKNKKYKSHYATILNWNNREQKANQEYNSKEPEWFNREIKKRDITDKEKEKLENLFKEVEK